MRYGRTQNFKRDFCGNLSSSGSEQILKNSTLIIYLVFIFDVGQVIFLHFYPWDVSSHHFSIIYIYLAYFAMLKCFVTS